ncbi:retron St85 family RNA-directed DNA polymerase [Burkholderia gladioli]|uniref:retron St85 family RNA-directed DNA polymerase n=1 Tax=Burkholderia gladioli TaxID=28095 RepID=UPI002030BD9D|nr:retron St85 family RNA-directed DNA polymerase [Burkholderia gladioli]URV24877.1 retron St85 family RNA-directed DNA polymerase [Burkholderia gladioli]
MDLIDRLQAAFPLSRAEVELLIKTAPRRYKIHTIEKRNGRGLREIAQPTAELKLVQRWIVSTYINELPVHSAAIAYRPGLGIKDHAKKHAARKYLLKLDFKDFFPSIRAGDLRTHLTHHTDLSTADKSALMRLLFRLDSENGAMVLSIGAPSSPAISNTVMYPFDIAIADYCRENDIAYTRYADDLAFSTDTPHVLDALQDFIRKTCRGLIYPSLTLNEKKTVFTSKKFQRQLTGLILTNDGTVSLGREKKRDLRAMAHHFSRGALSNEEMSRLRGLLAFAMSIEPQFVHSIIRMIGKEAYAQLMHASGT